MRSTDPALLPVLTALSHLRSLKLPALPCMQMLEMPVKALMHANPVTCDSQMKAIDAMQVSGTTSWHCDVTHSVRFESMSDFPALVSS